MPDAPPSARSVLRAVLVVLGVAVAVSLAYLLRQPLGWLVLAAFVALAMTAPVGFLTRFMPRGAAVAVAFVVLVAVPLGLAALLVPRVVDGAVGLGRDLPGYVDDLQAAVQRSEVFQRIDEQFDIGLRLSDLADDVPGQLGSAAGVLSSVGISVLNSVFAAATILILSVFMVAGGPRWTREGLRLVPAEHRERTRRALHRVAHAVSSYVRVQLTIAAIAAVSGYVVMTILGLPFRELLAALIAFGSLIPVIGSPLWGVAIGLVALATGPLGTTLLWAVWALAYPQIENYVLQPQLQKKAVDVEPFVIIVAVLFGSTLFGVLGALLAIPAAATLQIALGEWLDWRRDADETRRIASVKSAQAPHEPSA